MELALLSSLQSLRLLPLAWPVFARLARLSGPLGLELHLFSLPVSKHRPRYSSITDRLIVMITTVAVALQERPSAAPDTKQWESDYKLVGNPTFTKAISAVASTIFAYAGTPGGFDSMCSGRLMRLSQDLIYEKVISLRVSIHF